MKAITYILFYIIAKPLSILPLKILYVLSDMFYIIIYKLIKYRVKVVEENIKNAFPEKNETERQQITRKFYKCLCDFFIENIKLLTITQDELAKRMVLSNPELINDLFDKKKHVILVSGHTFNWEWGNVITLNYKHQFYGVYHPLENKYFDQMYIKQRTRFGTKLVTMKNTFAALYAAYRRGELFCAAFIADQSPPREYNFWTIFLNQETAVFTGAERIARTMNAAVIFIKLTRLKRGYYQGQMHLITENAKQTPEHEITIKHTKMLEQAIKESPETWLWSHRRWKHKRQDQELHL